MRQLSTEGVPWFPQEYSTLFYIIKGITALIATVLLLAHTNSVWMTEMSLGRRLRYLALLYVAALMAFASVEQTQEDAVVNYRNLGGLLGALLIIVAAVVSIRESRRRP